jgi:hypothetical protein
MYHVLDADAKRADYVVQTTDVRIEIPEKPNARRLLLDAFQPFIIRVRRDTEEAELRIIEITAMFKDPPQQRLAGSTRRRRHRNETAVWMTTAR